MKHDCTVVVVIVFQLISLAKGLEWFGFINLAGMNDIIILLLIAVGAIVFLIWNDAEVWDESPTE